MGDTKEIINCPACGCEMKKIWMPEAGVNIDICLEGCGGIFFNNRELDKFDESHENINEILEAIKNKEFKKVDEAEVRICPLCDVSMVKMGACSGSVEIDVCNTCGGKFLDNGELQKIRSGNGNNNDDNLNRFLNYIYQENLREVTGGENKFKSSPRRQFFEDLVNKYLNR